MPHQFQFPFFSGDDGLMTFEIERMNFVDLGFRRHQEGSSQEEEACFFLGYIYIDGFVCPSHNKRENRNRVTWLG